MAELLTAKNAWMISRATAGPTVRPAHANHVHVVVLDTLHGREAVVNAGILSAQTAAPGESRMNLGGDDDGYLSRDCIGVGQHFDVHGALFDLD
jgi:hypothetical protein